MFSRLKLCTEFNSEVKKIHHFELEILFHWIVQGKWPEMWLNWQNPVAKKKKKLQFFIKHLYQE